MDNAPPTIVALFNVMKMDRCIATAFTLGKEHAQECALLPITRLLPGGSGLLPHLPM